MDIEEGVQLAINRKALGSGNVNFFFFFNIFFYFHLKHKLTLTLLTNTNYEILRYITFTVG